MYEGAAWVFVIALILLRSLVPPPQVYPAPAAYVIPALFPGQDDIYLTGERGGQSFPK